MNPTRNRTPICMSGGLGGDYVKNWVETLGIKQVKSQRKGLSKVCKGVIRSI